MSRFVAGHTQRRPSSEQQQSAQEMTALKEGTQIMHGLIQELSALKYVIRIHVILCLRYLKKEIPSAIVAMKPCPLWFYYMYNT